MVKFRLVYDNIEEIYVTRETDSTRWFKGKDDLFERSERKNSRWAGRVFDTYDEAKQELIRSIKSRINKYKDRIEYEEGLIESLK